MEVDKIMRNPEVLTPDITWTFQIPLTCGSPTMVESWGSTRISSTSPPSSGPPPPLPLPISNSAHGTTVAPRSCTTMTNAAPIASPEGVSDVSPKSGIWDGQNSSPGNGNEGPSRSVSHAASLDAISKRMVKSDMSRIPCRSLTCSVPTKHSKIFPGVASESDLQRWRASKERKSPSLSQMGSDSVKHKDNGSAKYFQGVMHTPNMGEKVAQSPSPQDIRLLHEFVEDIEKEQDDHERWKPREEEDKEWNWMVDSNAKGRSQEEQQEASTYLIEKNSHLPPPVIIRRKRIVGKSSINYRRPTSDTTSDSAGSDLAKITDKDDCYRFLPRLRGSTSCNGDNYRAVERGDSSTTFSSRSSIDKKSARPNHGWIHHPEKYSEEENIESSFGINRSFQRQNYSESPSISSSASSSVSSLFPLTRKCPTRNNQDQEIRELNQEIEEIEERNVRCIRTTLVTIDWPKRSFTIPLGRKLAAWGRESKNLVVKSVSSANTFVPTTMTCIKSPRAMSENLLGQGGGGGDPSIDCMTMHATTPSKSLGHPSTKSIRGGSFRESDRLTTPIVIEPPGSSPQHLSSKQKWSSVRVKGSSTKSLLVENGGPQQVQLKSTIHKEGIRNEIEEKVFESQIIFAIYYQETS
ncbi:hypothetical protein PV325_001003 [Microctonus aethiopoides]|nr:hypothetical protein PV325_001003 [Microctonus aethiopoides]